MLSTLSVIDAADAAVALRTADAPSSVSRSLGRDEIMKLRALEAQPTGLARLRRSSPPADLWSRRSGVRTSTEPMGFSSLHSAIIRAHYHVGGIITCTCVFNLFRTFALLII